MARTGDAWVPDGRARAIRADCEASLESLDGLPIDLFLVHAPDPRTPWRTTVRALARLVDEGLVERVGVCNVTRGQLDEARDLAPIAAVQVALSPFDDRALRGGVVGRCDELGIALVAHSPLGGPRRAGRLGRREELTRIAEAHESTPAEVALAWLLGLSPVVVPIPGARRPETARSSARAASLELDPGERELLERALGGLRPATAARRARRDGEVVVVMGIPGAGKSRIAEGYAARGHERLNRDELGGSLRDIAAALDDVLAAGATRVVLDNTYLTRAARSHVVEIAARHGLPTRCVWLDTSLAQAQVNLVERLLDHFGSLPTAEELKQEARRVPGLHTPTTQMRTFRELEPPEPDEGFADVERVPFERRPTEGAPGVLVAAAALTSPEWERIVAEADPEAPHLVFDWRPGAIVDDLEAVAGRLAKVVSGPVERALCPHPGGPPTCWCRPPLPGLPLAFARSHGVDPARSTVVGASPAHRTLATTLGASYASV
jgi:diketogulonate reductase-like aldo/keto reductase/predicted kinase